MVGGQAVIEGVMMRGPARSATAVRTPDGRISVESKEVRSFSDRFPVFKKPFLRGTVALVESLVIGIRSLSWSAKMAGEEEEQLSDKELAGTIAVAFVLAAVLFIALPTGAAKLFHAWSDDPVFLNLAEGFLRLFIFLAYIWGISRMKDIQRVFQYHGAEHKTIFCFEAGLPLTAENAQKFERFHPRCGTSFLLIVMLVSIFVFAFLGWPDLWLRIVGRIVLLPGDPPGGQKSECVRSRALLARTLAAAADDARAGRFDARSRDRIAEGGAARGQDSGGKRRLSKDLGFGNGCVRNACGCFCCGRRKVRKMRRAGQAPCRRGKISRA